MLLNQNIEKNRNLGLGIKVIKYYISGRYINDIIAFNPPFLWSAWLIVNIVLISYLLYLDFSR